eukprot:gene4821-6756_t
MYHSVQSIFLLTKKFGLIVRPFRYPNIDSIINQRFLLDTTQSLLTQQKIENAVVENSSNEGRKKRQKRNKGDQLSEENSLHRKNANRIAIESWSSSLIPEKDYNYTFWRTEFHSRSTVDFFNGYAKKLSNIFKSNNAKVNFAMVGACDGTGDNTIKYIYLPNNHWRGVFVEPISFNVRDLINYLSNNNVSHRSVVIHAAATSQCATPTLTVERPLYEEKNVSIPHWLRRQIGSVLPKTRAKPRKEWTAEIVRCVTANDILSEWYSKGYNQRNNGADESKKKKKPRRRRPHVLKIDVEGHDYEVLMSFMSEEVPQSELPLLIDFEAKSIAKKYPAAKARMESRGYVVSPFGQDGFALLKAEFVFYDETAYAMINKISSLGAVQQ